MTDPKTDQLPEPRLTLIYRLEASVGEPLELGETSQGRRRIIPLTGGTFTGVARFVKEKNPRALGIAVETQGSVLGGGKPGDHRIEGIGSSFIPKTFDGRLADQIIKQSPLFTSGCK